ncbi:MAG: lipopolysaccharide assembly protein LapA domain-containing protein [Candidatus Rokuibacteriota bacterium]
MTFKIVFVAVLASALTLFALQNGTPTSVRFLFWTLDGASLAAVILLSAATGIVLVGVPLWLERWRLQGQVRALEARLGAAEVAGGAPRESA